MFSSAHARRCGERFKSPSERNGSRSWGDFEEWLISIGNGSAHHEPPNNKSSNHFDPHFLQHAVNGRDESIDVARENTSDGTDAKRVRPADFARINDKALVAEQPVKSVEGERVSVRIVKRGDDGTLDRRIEIRTKAELFHPLHQRLLVPPVTLAAFRDAAFVLQFLHRLLEGEERMRRGRVAELAVLVEPLELIEQVEAETARVTFAGKQRIPTADDERKTGHALDAFIRR